MAIPALITDENVRIFWQELDDIQEMAAAVFQTTEATKQAIIKVWEIPIDDIEATEPLLDAAEARFRAVKSMERIMESLKNKIHKYFGDW